MMVLFLMHRSARRADGAHVVYFFSVLNLNHSFLFKRAPLTPDCEPEQIRLSISVNRPG